MSRTGGTDHVFMQAVGVPGFQFIQDPLDYSSRLHHTNVDTFDHLKAEDMRQGSIVLASLLLDAANADKALPRPPMPTEPMPTDPYAYPDEERSEESRVGKESVSTCRSRCSTNHYKKHTQYTKARLNQQIKQLHTKQYNRK